MKLFREIVSDVDNDSLVLIDESAQPERKPADVEKEHKQLKHLHHLEDLPIHHGAIGFGDALDTLSKTHDYLQGKKRNGYSIQTKFDGSPSIVWGRHPETGKFFIGTKSFFNKTPKINYTAKDIETNHGNNAGVADALKFLLPILKKSSPKEGVFQGDLMYTAPDVRGEGGKLSFQPNTIQYNVDRDSNEGRKILASKAGIAAHTSYQMGKEGELEAMYDIDMGQFKPTDDVHFFPTKFRGPFSYSGKEAKEFSGHHQQAIAASEQLRKSGAYDAITGHEKLLMGYINNAVKEGKNLSAEGYVSFLHSQAGKRTEKLTMDHAKNRIKKEVAEESKNVIANKAKFNALFKAHKHIQNAKNVLVNALSKNSPYQEKILGEPSKPEGFVVNNNGRPIKLVDRQHFSSANFEWNQKANPSDNPLVLSFGRMNPPTTGHEAMIQTGEKIASRSGAKHKVVASRSQGSADPLTPAQKLAWYKQFFPGKDISLSPPGGDHGLVGALNYHHGKGVRDITIVAGHDRVKDYEKILAKYNGDGKLWQFKRARVISAGKRDDKAEGTAGASGHKMRQAARHEDYQTFRSMVPKHIDEPSSQNMFHELRAQMGVVKINSLTGGHSLATYAKRTDKIGKDAQAEISRRKRAGTWKATE